MSPPVLKSIALMLPIGLILTGCQNLGILLSGTSKVENQVDEEISPTLTSTICEVLGGPIMWSGSDTEETVKQIEVLHNSQWVGFKCGGSDQ